MISADAIIHRVPCDAFISGDTGNNTFLIHIDTDIKRMEERVKMCEKEMQEAYYFTRSLPDALAYANKHLTKLKFYKGLGLEFVSHERYQRDI